MYLSYRSETYICNFTIPISLFVINDPKRFDLIRITLPHIKIFNEDKELSRITID